MASYFRFVQHLEAWREVVEDAVRGPWQSDAPHQEDEEHHVGQQCRHPHRLHQRRRKGREGTMS